MYAVIHIGWEIFSSLDLCDIIVNWPHNPLLFYGGTSQGAFIFSGKKYFYKIIIEETENKFIKV